MTRLGHVYMSRRHEEKRSSNAEKWLLEKSNAELLYSASRKSAKKARTEDSFTETVLRIYLRLTFHVEKAIAPYYCKEVLELLLFTS